MRRVPAWVAPASLYLVAVAARLSLAWTRPFGDEAHHYYIARHFGHGPTNVLGMLDNEWLFWWRPLFSLLLSPGAQFGFTGFRVGYVLLAAVLAPALWSWLRGRGVSPVASATAGGLAALHPFLVVWGVRAFPDGLMVAVFVAGLAVWERGRVLAGAALLLAATWVKEVALVGVAVILVEELLPDVHRDRWDLQVRLRPRHVALLAVLALSYVPHLYAESIGGRSPGWSRDGSLAAVVDGAFTTIWFVPLVAVGLLFRQSRRPAILALAYLAFFGGYAVAFGGRAEQWYFVMPTVLGIAAAVAAIDAARVSARPALRRLARPAAAVAVAILAAQVLLPAATAGKQEALHPTVDVFELSYLETVRAERGRDQDLWTALDQLRGDDLHNVFLVDVAWFFAIWPVSERADLVATAYTVGSAPDGVWVAAIEEVANTTFLRVEGTPLNLAIRDVYEDCITVASREYVILRGQGCQGRGAQLHAAFDARQVQA
ncbi:MAG: hypothetical protein AABY18_06570 [Candidatus Thermoplasmatota archaeon]